MEQRMKIGNVSMKIGNVILSMREFQKENNIKRECVVNTQYLRDIIKMNSSSNVKVKAVLVFAHYIDENGISTSKSIGGHLVVQIDDDKTVFDPSYDVFCLENKSYFDNIKDFMDLIMDMYGNKNFIDIKKVLSDHIQFIKIANRINNGAHGGDKKFYNNQADYIEKLYC